MKHKKSKIRCKKLPTHSFESHPAANAGEVKKPFVIAIIVVVAIISLSLLLLFSDQFVGKAHAPGVANTAGIEDLTANAYSTFSVTVKANIGAIGAAETVAIGFNLILPAGLTCNNVQSLLGWNQATGAVLETAICDNTNNQIVFEYATLNWTLARTGQFPIAQLNFNALAVGRYDLNFASFEIIDLATLADLIEPDTTAALGGTVTVQALSPGVFSTTITAIANIPEATVYTSLLDANNVVLVLKSERMPAMIAGRTYVATVNYPEAARVAKKIVLVRDVPLHRGSNVYALLEDVIPSSGTARGKGVIIG